MSFDEIKAAVLALGAEDQRRLVAALEHHLGDDVPLTAAQVDQVRAEQARIKTERDEGVPWNVLREDLRGKLDEIQHSRDEARAAARP